MKKLLLTILATGAIALSPLLFAGSVSAYDALGNACGAGGANPLCSANEGDVDSAITNITNITHTGGSTTFGSRGLIYRRCRAFRCSTF